MGDIAPILGLTENAVRVRICRARNLLREKRGAGIGGKESIR